MIDLEHFEWDGYVIVPSVFSSEQIAQMIASLDADGTSASVRAGKRDIAAHVPALRAVADAKPIRSIVERVLGADAFVVRSTLFDKTPDANWKVPWHQDLTIAVQARIDVAGYGPWSIKEGVQHVQPPTHVLERMLTVRIHLDDCPPMNGPLRVMPGSHRLGRVDQNRAANYVKEDDAVVCTAAAGAALVMRPLLLHASSRSTSPAHRRVLHFDFASTELDGPLQWFTRLELPAK